MKRSIGSLIFAVVALVAGSAHGIIRPGWERPILRAQLQPLDRVPVRGKIALTMNKRDGAKEATSFTLVQEQIVFCIKAPCPPIRQTRQFTVVGPSKLVGCGSKRFTAVEQIVNGPTDVPRTVLTVVDHTKRICDDFKPYSWEVTLQSRREATRRFGGNPQPVYTIQRD